MKTLFTFLVVGILAIGTSFAQEKGTRQNRTPEERAKMQVERLTKELNLNQSQQDSIYNFFIQSQTDFRNQSKETNHEKMKEEMEMRNNRIKSFLTDEQKTKYEELQKTQRRSRTPQN